MSNSEGCERCGHSYTVPIGMDDNAHGMCWLCEIKTLHELVGFQDKLLASYRLGRHPGEKTLDGILKARQRLKMV